MNEIPYQFTAKCVERLLREYNEHKSLIVAVDFDNTVYDYHNLGHSYDDVIRIMRACQELGFYIVLFTSSHPDQYEMQRKYLHDRGVSINCTNSNPIPLPFGNHGKMYYNILLDDRAGLGQALDILEQTIDAIKGEA